MLQLQGDWYDGVGSKKTSIRLTLDSNGLVKIFEQDNEHLIFSIDQQQVSISSRLGNSPRYLNMPEGQSVESLDNDIVDNWIKTYRPSFFSGLIHRLESNLKFVALTLILVIGVVWLTLQHGVPIASNAVAKALPSELLDTASEETLLMMEKYWLEPSELSEARQQQLQRHFSEAIGSHQDLRIKVGFRKSEAMGANAFALPNGHIIFTDAIVALATHDDELLAILGHEIGHVKYRHSLRRIVQNSLFIFLLAMITGDVSGTSEIVLGLPVLFAELAYSRAHETESDLYALAFLKARNIPPHRFSDLMLRIEASMLDEEDMEKKSRGENTEKELQWQRYLSTHPMTAERIKAFQ